LRLGILKVGSFCRMVSSLDVDPMFMKWTDGRGKTGEGFSGRYASLLFPFSSSFLGSAVSWNIGACSSSWVMFVPGEMWDGSSVSGLGNWVVCSLSESLDDSSGASSWGGSDGMVGG
jgi:hypothetical protein